MAKTVKTAEGWLYGNHGWIWFIPDAPWLWRPSGKDYGYWNMPGASREWYDDGAEGFSAQYDFLDEDGKPCEPPRPGECFWVELEL